MTSNYKIVKLIEFSLTALAWRSMGYQPVEEVFDYLLHLDVADKVVICWDHWEKIAKGYASSFYYLDIKKFV